MKKLYPNLYLKKVEDITIEILIKNKIKLLILDVDNTLIDYYKNLSQEVINWAKEMKGQGIKYSSSRRPNIYRYIRTEIEVKCSQY